MPEWTRQHELMRGQFLELIHRAAPPFEEQGQKARAERRALPPLQWCCAYLPHYFDRPFAPFHRRMVQAVGGAAMPTFVAAFRGAGKSVLLALALPLRRVLEGGCPYILYGSQVQKLAAQTMDFLRLELDHNPRLRGDYGPISTDGPADCWTVSVGGAARGESGGRFDLCRLEAFGIGMSPRGRRFRQWRPHEFIGDDLETAELARNPEREQNLWDWMMDEVAPALEPERYTFTVLGTMFGPGCMMERARELAGRDDAEGRALGRMFLQAATERGKSVWPERFSDSALARVRQTIGLRNWLRNYALVADDPTRPFQPAWIGAYDPAELDRDRLDVVCFLDPAVSLSAKGCPRALVAVGADRTGGVRYVLDAWIARGSPMQMLDRLMDFHRRYRPRLIGIEENGGYALIRPLLNMRSGGRFLPVRYVTHTVAKELRIERLSPQFEAGRWLFPKTPSPGVEALQEQLLAYPDGFVDGPDALAGCDELLPDTFAPAPDPAYASLSRRRHYEGL